VGLSSLATSLGSSNKTVTKSASTETWGLRRPRTKASTPSLYPDLEENAIETAAEMTQVEWSPDNDAAAYTTKESDKPHAWHTPTGSQGSTSSMLVSVHSLSLSRTSFYSNRDSHNSLTNSDFSRPLPRKSSPGTQCHKQTLSQSTQQSVLSSGEPVTASDSTERHKVDGGTARRDSDFRHWGVDDIDDI
jgi:hypothetical protein